MAFKMIIIQFAVILISIIMLDGAPVVERIIEKSINNIEPVDVIEIIIPGHHATRDLIENNINKPHVIRHHRDRRDGGSVIEQDKKIIDDMNDLETAAGTNVIRPLFVYRQQQAYRAASSKRAAAERREAGNGF